MPLTPTQQEQVNIALHDGIFALVSLDWISANQHFDVLLTLLRDNLNESNIGVNLTQCVEILSMTAKFKLGKKDEVWNLYTTKVGIIGNLRLIENLTIENSSDYSRSLARHIICGLLNIPRALLSLAGEQGVTITFNGSKGTVSGGYIWLEVSFLQDRRLIRSINGVVNDLKSFLKKRKNQYLEENKFYRNNCTHDTLGIPSYLEMAILANDAYEKKDTCVRSSISSCPHKNHPEYSSIISSDWALFTIIDKMPGYNPNTHFYRGKAYINDKKKLVIIASKGTDPLTESLDDWEKANFYIILGTLPKLYFEHARQFYSHVMEQLKSVNKEDYLPYLTGHSLGAALAELLSCKYNTPAITFDSPGVYEIINSQNFEEGQTNQTRIFNHPLVDVNKPHTVPVVSILARPNLINTCQHHVGRVLCLPISVFRPQEWEALVNPFGIQNIAREVLKVGIEAASKTLYAAIDATLETSYSHDLPEMIKYFSRDPPPLDPLWVVKIWAREMSQAAIKSIVCFETFYYFFRSIEDFPPVIRRLFIDSKLKQDANFPTILPNQLKPLLENMLYCNFDGIVTSSVNSIDSCAYVLTHGKIAVDEIRLFMWHCAYHPRFASLRTFCNSVAPQQQQPIMTQPSPINGVAAPTAQVDTTITAPIPAVITLEIPTKTLYENDNIALAHLSGRGSLHNDKPLLSNIAWLQLAGLGLGLGLGGYVLVQANRRINWRSVSHSIYNLFAADPASPFGWTIPKSLLHGFLDAYIVDKREKIWDMSRYSIPSQNEKIVLTSSAITFILRKVLQQLLNPQGNFFCKKNLIAFAFSVAVQSIYSVSCQDPSKNKSELASMLPMLADIYLPIGISNSRMPTIHNNLEPDDALLKAYAARGISHLTTRYLIQPVTENAYFKAKTQVKKLMADDALSPWLAGCLVGVTAMGAYILLEKYA